MCMALVRFGCTLVLTTPSAVWLLVCTDGCWRLLVSHLLENGSDVYTFSYNDVECCKFGFGGGRHNVF